MVLIVTAALVIVTTALGRAQNLALELHYKGRRAARRLDDGAFTNGSAGTDAGARIDPEPTKFSASDWVIGPRRKSGVKRVIVSINVKVKIDDQSFFRTHPSEDYERSGLSMLYHRKSRRPYLVHPAIYDRIAAKCDLVTVYTCADDSGEFFLQLVKECDRRGNDNEWFQTRHEACRQARKYWTLVEVGGSNYQVSIAEYPKPDPDWSELPSFDELLEKGFHDHKIEDWDHPILKELRGSR